ncbi:Sec-independent protein translocase protein TatA [Duganella sp. 1411]|uniref:hypothetical protein n=1 Tax=Duganella sp. 1411 TaxID=2806572 RepID=UPI001AE402FC|nr:hypothetical protein [Duganella sp. 1411]MBP1207996.1 Sec-independent protein translocase protein TatA [Duganella sp. 1411]
MDQSKIIYFQETYSRLSDDELAYLIATRSDSLVEEARIALSKVLDTRDLKNIQTEIKSTVEDLNSQAEFESERAQQQKLQRSTRKAFHAFCALFFIVGVGLLVFGDNERGPILVAAGLVASALFELRRLAGKYIVALFKMN